MMLSLLFAISSFVWCLHISFVATQGPSSRTPPYELIVRRADSSTRGARVDLITLQCRENRSMEIVSVQDINFWLNRMRPDDPDLKEEDYVIINDDNMGVTFQLRQEGYYTCGRRTDAANVDESKRVAVLGKPQCLIYTMRYIYIHFGITHLYMHMHAQHCRPILKAYYSRL